jgi:hypothetical protein
LDKDSSGSLDLEEFKAFTQDTKANAAFKAFAQRMRLEHEKRFGQGRVKTYLPFCISRLLEHLSFIGRREVISEAINSGDSHHVPLINIKNFIKLFLLNQENAQSCSISNDYENTLLGRLLA